MTKHVLIVDDEAYIRELIRQTLEDFEDDGVVLMTADNGLKGLEIIQSVKPNLVFLDVMMPEMNGFEVCKRVKADPALQDTYIVILTAKGQETDRTKGDEVGVDMYITKPFDPDLLEQLALNILQSQ